MASNKNTGVTQGDDLDQLFPSENGGDGDDFADLDGLMSGLSEDDAEGWKPEDKGEAVGGTLVKISQTRSDFAQVGEDPMKITWTIRTREGKRYRVIGYSKVLQNEMEESGAVIGDLVGVKYFGKKPIKKGPFAGKMYHDYGVARLPQKTQG